MARRKFKVREVYTEIYDEETILGVKNLATKIYKEIKEYIGNKYLEAYVYDMDDECIAEIDGFPTIIGIANMLLTGKITSENDFGYISFNNGKSKYQCGDRWLCAYNTQAYKDYNN